MLSAENEQSCLNQRTSHWFVAKKSSRCTRAAPVECYKFVASSPRHVDTNHQQTTDDRLIENRPTPSTYRISKNHRLLQQDRIIQSTYNHQQQSSTSTERLIPSTNNHQHRPSTSLINLDNSQTFNHGLLSSPFFSLFKPTRPFLSPSSSSTLTLSPLSLTLRSHGPLLA